MTLYYLFKKYLKVVARNCKANELGSINLPLNLIKALSIDLPNSDYLLLVFINVKFDALVFNFLCILSKKSMITAQSKVLTRDFFKYWIEA